MISNKKFFFAAMSACFSAPTWLQNFDVEDTSYLLSYFKPNKPNMLYLICNSFPHEQSVKLLLKEGYSKLDIYIYMIKIIFLDIFYNFFGSIKQKAMYLQELSIEKVISFAKEQFDEYKSLYLLIIPTERECSYYERMVMHIYFIVTLSIFSSILMLNKCSILCFILMCFCFTAAILGNVLDYRIRHKQSMSILSFLKKDRFLFTLILSFPIVTSILYILKILSVYQILFSIIGIPTIILYLPSMTTFLYALSAISVIFPIFTIYRNMFTDCHMSDLENPDQSKESHLKKEIFNTLSQIFVLFLWGLISLLSIYLGLGTLLGTMVCLGFVAYGNYSSYLLNTALSQNTRSVWVFGCFVSLLMNIFYLTNISNSLIWVVLIFGLFVFCILTKILIFLYFFEQVKGFIDSLQKFYVLKIIFAIIGPSESAIQVIENRNYPL